MAVNDPYAYQIWVCSACEGECGTFGVEVGDIVCLSCGNEYELSYSTNARLVLRGDEEV